MGRFFLISAVATVSLLAGTVATSAQSDSGPTEVAFTTAVERNPGGAPGESPFYAWLFHRTIAQLGATAGQGQSSSP